MIENRLIRWGRLNPKQVFLVDGVGALISALFLGLILIKHQPVIGLPESALYFLASFPVLFAVYDFFCFAFLKLKARALLKGIAYANLCFCLTSLIVTLFHFQLITFLGLLYILIEVFIVAGLAFTELRIAKRLT